MNHNYAEHGFGLILTGEEITKFVEKFNGKNRQDVDERDIVFSKKFEGSSRYYGEEAEGKTFYPVDCPSGDVETVENEDMLVFWAKNQPDAFKAVYTRESVVKEFADFLGEYLPEGFDYILHIGYFHCCMYC